jgi:membrane-associated protease RseP (regulator of RpoE activity)
MSSFPYGGNGHGSTPVEVLDVNFRPLGEQALPPSPKPQRLWLAVLLFLLTLLSTLAVGSEFASSYAQNREPFSGGADPFSAMLVPFEHPQLLLLGVPFSFTLMGILLAHELGHYYACKIYGIDVTYPYFIPAPTLFGTFGAFIRIRSPITTRKALFDVGIAGPVVGFLLAAPAMAYAVATSRIVPGVQNTAEIVFGQPPLMRFFIMLFHPHVDPSWLLLSPVGRAAWVGFFATALNLLPLWQLDGGHIVYSLTSKQHHRISIAVALILLVLGRYAWSGWYMWGGLLLILTLRFGHPPVLDHWEKLDASRKLWAIAALAIFLSCFTATPALSR